jgi:hypothetical protein
MGSEIVLSSVMGLRVGDRLTIGGDPRAWTIIAIDGTTLTCQPYDCHGMGWFWVWWLLGTLAGAGLLQWVALR